MPFGLEEIHTEYDIAVLIFDPLINIQPLIKLSSTAIEEVLSIETDLIGWKVRWSELQKAYCVVPPSTVDRYQAAERIALGLEKMGLKVLRKSIDKAKEYQSFILA